MNDLSSENPLSTFWYRLRVYELKWKTYSDSLKIMSCRYVYVYKYISRYCKAYRKDMILRESEYVFHLSY